MTLTSYTMNIDICDKLGYLSFTIYTILQSVCAFFLSAISLKTIFRLCGEKKKMPERERATALTSLNYSEHICLLQSFSGIWYQQHSQLGSTDKHTL